MRVPIEILVLACLIIGIVPAATIGPFLDTAVQSVLREETPSYSLAVWHGFTQPLLMSVIALVSGAAGYLLFRDRLNRAVGAPFISWLQGPIGRAAWRERVGQYG